MILLTIWALLREALLEVVMKIHNFSGGPTDSPEEQREWKKEGARPKNPWAYRPIPHDDEGIPMTEFSKEKSGLPKQKGSAETSH